MPARTPVTFVFSEVAPVVAGAFLAVLRRPGVWRPAVGAMLGSLPIGMLGLAVLLMVQRWQGAFAAAGATVGMLGAGTAVGMIVQGRLIDRFGPAPVLLAAAGMQLIGLAGLVVAGRSGAGVAVQMWAFLSGAGEPQVNASLRALWPALVPPRLMPAAMTLSSMLFEIPVLLGPLILTAILLVAGPATVMVLCGVLSASGTAMLAGSRSSRAWRGQGRPTALIGALASPAIRTLLLVAAGHGVIVGLVQVSAAARFTQQTGFMYAALSAGSLSGAVLWGTRSQNGRPGWRLAILTIGCAVALGAASTTASPVAFAGSLFLAGHCLGPAGVLTYALAGRLAPSGHTVEAFTMVTAIGLSAVAVGTTLAGTAADRLGPDTALTAAAVGAVLLAALPIARRQSLPAEEHPPHRKQPKNPRHREARKTAEERPATGKPERQPKNAPPSEGRKGSRKTRRDREAN